MIALALIALVVAAVTAWGLTYVRLVQVSRLYRHQLLATQPSPGQIWEQDGTPLYVVAVAPPGSGGRSNTRSLPTIARK